MRWNGFKSRIHKKFYVKLLIIFTLFIVLPVGVVSLINYFNARQAVYSEIENKNQLLMENLRQSLEIVVDQINVQMNYLLINSNTADYENFMNSEKFETGSVDQFSDDMQEFHEYINLKRNLIKMLGTLKVNNWYINSIYFYDPLTDILITSDSTQHSIGTFYDVLWYEKLNEGSLKNKSVFYRDAVIDRKGTQKQFMTILYDSIYKSNYFVVNIDVEKLYNNLVRKMAGQIKGTFYILLLDGTAALKIQNGEVELNSDEYIIRTSGDEVWFEYDRDPQEIIVETYSRELSCFFLNIVPKKDVYGGFDIIRDYYLIFVFLVLALFIVLLVLLLGRIYAPVEKILGLIYSKFDSSQDPDSVNDEFAYIEDEIRNTRDEISEIRNKYDNNIKVLKGKFLNELISRNSYVMDEIKENFSALDIQIPIKDLIVLLVEYKNKGPFGSTTDYYNEKLSKVYVEETFTHFGYPDFPCEAMQFDQRLCIICSVHQESIDAFLEKLRNAEIYLRQNKQIDITVGISSSGFTIDNLPRAYNQAKMALKGKCRINKSDKILQYDENDISHGCDLSYIYDSENQLKNAIITVDINKMKQVLTSIREKTEMAGDKLRINELQQIIICIIDSVMKEVLRLGRYLDMMPCSKITIGWDVFNLETLYGSCLYTREIISEVLQRKIKSRLYSFETAMDVARKIIYENAEKIYDI